MQIEITPEMLEEARKRKQEAEQLANAMPDDGADGDNICISCQ